VCALRRSCPKSVFLDGDVSHVKKAPSVGQGSSRGRALGAASSRVGAGGGSDRGRRRKCAGGGRPVGRHHVEDGLPCRPVVEKERELAAEGVVDGGERVGGEEGKGRVEEGVMRAASRAGHGGGARAAK